MGGGKKRESYTQRITGGGGRKAGGCKDLSFEAELVNIQAGLNQVSVGQFMRVRLNGKIIECYNAEDGLCGNVSSSKNGDLINCIEEGYYFKAKLLTKKGGIKIMNGK